MSEQRSPRKIRYYLLTILLLAGLFVLVWFKPWNREDLTAAAIANAKGVGHMEQFDTPDGYAVAIKEFERAMLLAPNWTPAKINLGIALYNTAQSQTDPVLDRAAALFREVLTNEPKNPYAHYNLGMIFLYKNDLPQAAIHFNEVTRIDPNDAHAWYHRGVTHPEKDDSPEAKEFFAKALKLNPYLNAARYALALHAHERDEEKTRAMLAEKKALEEANWESEYRIRYSEMGKYAEVIGKSPTPAPLAGPVPLFNQKNAVTIGFEANTVWPKLTDFGEFKAHRDRFGGVLLRLDYNKDGLPDVMLLGGALRNGVLGDLFFKNQGNGKFDDLSNVLLSGAASLGGAVGDYDNDGWPDVVLTQVNGVKLFKNQQGAGFTEMTQFAGLDTLKGRFLTACWIDLDQDGDLDLCLAKDGPEGGLVVGLNTGVAEPGVVRLTTSLKLANNLPGLEVTGAVTGLIASDVDDDRDIDLILLQDGKSPRVIFNDRLLRFHSGPDFTPEKATWYGGMVLNTNPELASDVVLLGDGGAKYFARKTEGLPNTSVTWPALLQAHVQDVNLDGYTDIVGLDANRKPFMMHNLGNGFKPVPQPFGPAPEAISNIQSVGMADFLNDGQPSLLVWSVEGLSLFKNNGIGAKGLSIDLTGRRDKGSNLRTNSDGTGSTLEVLASSLRTRQELTTRQAGLGQSLLPNWFGLGTANAADAVRIRWPDGVPQSELNQPAGTLARISEQNRKGTSCPILLTWNGERFQYVTDFLGGGALAELGPDGSIRPPRPEESVKIEAGQLVEQDGKFQIKLAEPMDEVMYLDHLKLDVIDHPNSSEVHPDERFSTGGPAPTQSLQQFNKKHYPVQPKDHRGHNVLSTLKDRDTKTVDRFKHRSWLGFAEDHFVELEFTNLPNGNLTMVLAGWIDYPYPESIFAASQAGVPMLAPVLERETTPGTWAKVCDLGFPAGLPKVMTREVNELRGLAKARLRIRTNLQIYWDEIYIGEPTTPSSVQGVSLTAASLKHRGFMQEVSRGGTAPIEYNDERTEAVSTTRWKGNLTRIGDVLPLLQGLDDQFVLCGPGDEVLVEFDAKSLPPIRPGHTRSYVLRTFGYCKDTSPFTLTGGQVGPLPHRGMKNYPLDVSGAPTEQLNYAKRWNTR